MNESASIGVVIVSYNTVALLRNCLASLRACTLPLRIVVVDNRSHDNSAAMVRAEFPQVELLALAQNLGFAGGTNVGLGHLGYSVQGTGDRKAAWSGDDSGEPMRSQGTRRSNKARSSANDSPRQQGPGSAVPCSLLPVPYTLVLNPDTVVQPGAIEALAAFLDAHPRVGLVGPRLLNPDGSPQTAAFRFPTLLMTTLDLFPPGEVLPGRLYGSWWHGRYPQERGETPFPIDHPLGACMLVRGATIEQVGGLDTSYFMYSEEIEWCWRIRAAGWAIWQLPTASVTHVGGAATRQFRWKMLVELYRSRFRFVAQHGPAKRLAAFRALVRVGMLRLALLAWRDYTRRRLDRDELRARLLAYGEISRL